VGPRTFDPAGAPLGWLFPPEVAVAVGSADSDERLDPIEEAAIATASATRRREFHAGRTAARAALRDLGVPYAILPKGADRLPRWPDGYLGSIAHCPGCCVAAAARCAHLAGVGLDAEVRCRVRPRLHAAICTASERSWMDTVDGGEETATLLFSAKEAVYKCLHPATGVRLDFADVNITVVRSWSAGPGGTAAGEFTADVRAALPAAWRHLGGRFVLAPDHVVTAVSVAASEVEA
jgi:4'-phosphopantetheinyl transferase EntD